MATRIDPLENALRELDDRELNPIGFARAIDAALKSAVRAVTPGRQQAKNLTPLVDAARTAFCRTLRRRAKA